MSRTRPSGSRRMPVKQVQRPIAARIRDGEVRLRMPTSRRRVARGCRESVNPDSNNATGKATSVPGAEAVAESGGHAGTTKPLRGAYPIELPTPQARHPAGAATQGGRRPGRPARGQPEAAGRARRAGEWGMARRWPQVPHHPARLAGRTREATRHAEPSLCQAAGAVRRAADRQENYGWSPSGGWARLART